MSLTYCQLITSHAAIVLGAMLTLTLSLSANALESVDTQAVLAIERPASPTAKAKYSRKGADTCLQCHDQSATFEVMALFKTRHGALTPSKSPDTSAKNPQSNNSKTSLSQGQCEVCHGPIGGHGKKRLRKGVSRPAMLDFSGQQSQFSTRQINQVCSNCHQGPQIGHWQGSMHQQSDTLCSDCHSIHNKLDPVSQADGQLAVCGKCHGAQKHLNARFSKHPIGKGKMACSDCHQSHDSDSEHLLVAESINDTCYLCHGDKRGPFLWPHEPVSEDCTLCHNAHGSNHAHLLKQRAPFLCQQCHGNGHADFMTTNSSISGRRPSAFVVGKSCSNCHSSVHGSNHPSGAQLQR